MANPETALAKAQPTDLRFGGYEREQVEVIKATIAKGTSDAELALFCQASKRMGLDPFAKQIYAMMRWDNRAQREIMTVVVAIDGYRVVAHRTGEYDGVEGPFWCGPDGVWRELWLEDKPPTAAKAIVWRKGISRPFIGIVRWNAYAQRDKNGNLTGKWPSMGDHMLGKCAEALALRKAFPNDLSGTYVPEEMEAIDVEYVEEKYERPSVAGESLRESQAALAKERATTAAPVGKPKDEPGPAPKQETMREAQEKAAEEKRKKALEASLARERLVAQQELEAAERGRAERDAAIQKEQEAAATQGDDAELVDDFTLEPPKPAAPVLSVDNFRRDLAGCKDEAAIRGVKARYVQWAHTEEGLPFRGALKAACDDRMRELGLLK